MSFVEQAVEGVEVEGEYGRRNSYCSTPPTSFQHIQSRLIRPVPSAVNRSSSHCHIHRPEEAADTDFIVSLAEEGAEPEQEDKSCVSYYQPFKQHIIRSGSVPAMSSFFHPSQYNARDHCSAAENLADEAGEERGSYSSFQLIQQRLVRPSPGTQAELVSHHDQSSQCFSMEHTVNHTEANDGTLRNSGAFNVVAQKLEEKHLKLKMVADVTGSSTPSSSFPSLSKSSSTIGLHQIKQSSVSHPFTPLSVFQDCLKQMQSVRSTCRGDVCRRRLFGKSSDLDEDITMQAKRAKIEDYVDPFLLSEAAQKLRFLCQQDMLHSISLQLESNLVRSINSFDWPTAHLEAMTTSTPTNCFSLTSQQKLQTNDDLEIKQYSDVCNKSRGALFQDIKNQNSVFHAKDVTSQFSSCGWAIRDDDHGHDPSRHIHDSSSSLKVINYANNEGFALSPSTPDHFQSFDMTVSLFQT